MIIGIDFDNTIVNYDKVFFKAAQDLNLIPHDLDISKSSIRDFLRKNKLENEWTKLQGYVYGQKMEYARPHEGVISFIENCKINKIELFIISHKSKYPYLGPKYDLHTSAQNWLNKDPILKFVKTYFEITLAEKLSRIKTLNCHYFIDDLPELLIHNDFPKKVKKLLFDPHNIQNDSINYQRFITWHEIRKFFNI